ncbi:MAG TPA: tail fiber protein [Verrucomicrobiae bacterium]|jgi:microcystin-dependent protein
MSDQFVAEIRIVPFNFAPLDWAFCDGQLIAISQNTALFSLLGTTYGGDGSVNFALPNLQGAAPLHFGQGNGLSNYALGQTGGAASVTLAQAQMPAHTHSLAVNNVGGDVNTPVNNVPSKAHMGKTPIDMYADVPGGNPSAMSSQAVTLAGGSQPHNNMSPYLTLNFIIALQGVFPPRS